MLLLHIQHKQAFIEWHDLKTNRQKYVHSCWWAHTIKKLFWLFQRRLWASKPCQGKFLASSCVFKFVLVVLQLVVRFPQPVSLINTFHLSKSEHKSWRWRKQWSNVIVEEWSQCPWHCCNLGTVAICCIMNKNINGMCTSSHCSALHRILRMWPWCDWPQPRSLWVFNSASKQHQGCGLVMLLKQRLPSRFHDDLLQPYVSFFCLKHSCHSPGWLMYRWFLELWSDSC